MCVCVCVKRIQKIKLTRKIASEKFCLFLLIYICICVFLYIYIYIYIYIYCHPQTDCFVLSELFSVARPAGRSKPGSKPV